MTATDTLPVETKPEKQTPVNAEYIEHLRDKGLTYEQIGQLVGRSKSQVWKILDRLSPTKQLVERFQQDKGLEYNYAIAECAELLHQCNEKLFENLVDGKLTPAQITNVQRNAILGVGMFDERYRLHNGQSTQNVGVVSKLILESQQKQYDRQTNSEGNQQVTQSMSDNNVYVNSKRKRVNKQKKQVKSLGKQRKESLGTLDRGTGGNDER